MINSIDKLSDRKSNGILLVLSFAIVFGTGTKLIAQTDHVDGKLIQFNDNGAWSWFEDERAIIDNENGKLLVSSVADGSGALGRNGGADLVTFDFASRRTSRFSLNTNIQADDHNSAALLKMDDGRYLAAYSNHGTDNVTRSRTSVNLGDSSSWNSEVTRNNVGATTYNNLFQLSGENGRIYNFTRTANWDPNILVSDDNGASWQAGGNLIQTGNSSTRPYVKYTSNNVDEVHFINTENHPRNFNNSVYHAYMKGDQVFDSFGNVLDNNVDGSGIASNAGTKIYQGGSNNVAWVSDIHLDSNGNAFTAFSTQRDTGLDLRYHYARFDGTQWNEHEIAFAGTRLYAGEDDYTGNIALNPNNPDEVYISTNANPDSGAALISSADGQRHWEIFKGSTTDSGASWNWQAVTQNSTVDNLRPIIPESQSNEKAVLWMRGDYTTYLDYDLAVVGIINDPTEQNAPTRYFDANTSNTSRVDGQAWNPTEGTGRGANEGRWHLRQQFGNNGSVITSNELGGSLEDAPLLESTFINDDGTGNFDVFAYFWSNKNEDWEIYAGLAFDDLDYFQKQSGKHVDMNDFFSIVEVTTASGNEYMYEIYLGRIFLNQGDDFTVFIDDGPGINSRTWYDGVGLSRVSAVPEPASGILILLGVAATLLQRRRTHL